MNQLLVFGALILCQSFLLLSVEGGRRYGNGNKWSKYTASPTPYPTEEGDECTNKDGYWTTLYNRDDASEYGDDERLYKLNNEGENICNGKKPIDIECIELDDGLYQTFDEYEFDNEEEYDILYCNKEKGFRCKGYNCPNFGVRFCCKNKSKKNGNKNSYSDDDSDDKESDDRRR